MLRKLLIASAFAGSLAFNSLADVYVRVGPPRPLVERRIAPPGREYVWTPGYHRWDGRAYIWTPGQWVLPPRRHAHWIPARWVHRRGGWIFVEGHWR
jgi:hypothetical protein